MRSVENNEEIAYGIYAAYGALVYATPLLGGYYSRSFDWVTGKHYAAGVLMAVGHFFLWHFHMISFFMVPQLC